MITLEISLRHLAWSNQKFFSLFGEMPEEVFSLRSAENEWSIGELLVHVIDAQRWFKYCLEGGVEWTLPKLKPITNASIALEYLPALADLDVIFLDHLGLEDEEIIFHAGGTMKSEMRSFILSQPAIHMSEHKGEIATILKQHGCNINLNELDVLSYVNYTKTNQK